MEIKLRQVTDNIHGTIYLSKLESQMMSTPFFYRLHDIYQSSTVYMTFPSNRTKRYEHCLGTMEQAGQMFFSSITNADKDVRNQFINCLTSELQTIIDIFKSRSKIGTAFYLQNSQLSNILSSTFPARRCTIEVIKCNIAKAMRKNIISDPALDHQSVCFFDLVPDRSPSVNEIADDALTSAFLYQCALEAIRLAALFHDVGHPPYSHIIESTMKELYRTSLNCTNGEFDETKVEFLQEMLSPFMEDYAPPHLLLDSPSTTTPDCGNDGQIDPQLHELIGLRMLQTAFEGVLTDVFKDVSNTSTAAHKMAQLLYYIMVVEFTFSILLEKKPIFAAMHRMLDGPIDADRLDYIVRDTENAGINWGHIPYKRLVCSAKLVSPKRNQFSVAFPEKMADDLDDVIVARYKIFSRINFHHRSVKTAKLLQKAVYALAEDYLRTPASDDNDNDLAPEIDGSICPEIKDLWGALGAAFGQNEIENKAAKWNDSWLISMLHSALIKLSNRANLEDLCNNRADRSIEALELLKKLLDEVLLNHKHYFSLLKRQKDATNLMDHIMSRAEITVDKLDQLIAHEYSKLENETGIRADEARDSLHRIQILQNDVVLKADFNLLGVLLPGISCDSIITDILERAKARGEIIDFIVSPNITRLKLGISETDEKDSIYLYTPDGKVYMYDIRNTLYPLLQAYRTANLWLNVYVYPANLSNAQETLTELISMVECDIGDKIKDKFQELFLSSSQVSNSGSST